MNAPTPPALRPGDKGLTYRSVWNHLAEVEFRQGFTDVDGLRTRYVRAGAPDLPKLLLLHGTGGHWEAFMANLGPLSQHFECFAIDFLGCGFTDKPDRPYEIADYVDHVAAFADEFGIHTADVIGVSLGSWVAGALALKHPHLVRRTIMVAATGYLPLPQSSMSAIDVRRSSAQDPSWETIAEILGHLFHDPEHSLVDDLVAIRQRVYLHPDIERIMPRMLTLMEPEVRRRNLLTDDQWRAMQSPTLLIEAVDSDDVFLKTARALATLIPNVKSVEMPNVSHWAQFEDPETFNALALAWFGVDGSQ